MQYSLVSLPYLEECTSSVLQEQDRNLEIRASSWRCVASIIGKRKPFQFSNGMK